MQSDSCFTYCSCWCCDIALTIGHSVAYATTCGAYHRSVRSYIRFHSINLCNNLIGNDFIFTQTTCTHHILHTHYWLQCLICSFAGVNKLQSVQWRWSDWFAAATRACEREIRHYYWPTLNLWAHNQYLDSFFLSRWKTSSKLWIWLCIKYAIFIHSAKGANRRQKNRNCAAIEQPAFILHQFVVRDATTSQFL